MRNSRAFKLVFICAGLAAGAPAQALEWSGSLGADMRWFDWREHIGDKQILQEAGPLAAPVGLLELRQESFFASVEVAWGGGRTRYDGHLQGTPAQPIGPSYDADAWEEFIDAEWRLGWLGDKGSVHFGYMQRDWNRYIEGSATVNPAEERYRWRFVTFGGEAPLFASPRWRFAVNLGVPTESHQKVYARTHDDLVLEPGAGFFWRLSFPFRPEAPRYAALSLEPYYQQHYMQESDPVRITVGGLPTPSQAYQPASVRRELGLTLRWQLGGSGKP